MEILIKILYFFVVLAGLFQIVSSSKSLIKTYKETQRINWKELIRILNIVFWSLLLGCDIFFID